jgi:tetratricopeptide (TPR) repeat protein
MGELENTKALIAEGKDALAFSRTYEPPATVFQSEINLGTAYFLDGQWESALEHLQIGTDGSESIGARDDTIISASAIRARLLGEHGRTAEALPIARHAIEMAIAIRDDRAIGETERELGAVALASGDLVTARDALARSLAAYDKAHTPPDERARAKFLLAQATWPVDRAEAIDLAHAARSDLHGTSSPLTTRQEKQLDDMNRWLAAHH